MVLVRKLPGYRTAEPGLERKTLRLLAPALAIGLAILMAPSVALRILPWDMHPMELALLTAKADIYAAACMLAYWNVLVFIAFAALIVVLMKGPAYVADAYPLIDSESPRPLPSDE